MFDILFVCVPCVCYDCVCVCVTDFVFPSVFNAKVLSFTNPSAVIYLSNTNGIFQDQLHPTGTIICGLAINAATPFEYIVGIPTLNLINVAIISGNIVRKTYDVRAVYNDKITTVSTLKCSRGSHDYFVAYNQGSSCRAEVTFVHTTGTYGDMTVTTASGYQFVIRLRVWVPKEITIEPYNSETTINYVKTPWLYSGYMCVYKYVCVSFVFVNVCVCVCLCVFGVPGNEKLV